MALSASGPPRKVFDFLAPKYNCRTKQKSGQPIAKRLHIDASKHSPQFLSNSKELQDVFCEKLGCEPNFSRLADGLQTVQRGFLGDQAAERCKFAAKKLVAHDGISMLR